MVGQFIGLPIDGPDQWRNRFRFDDSQLMIRISMKIAPNPGNLLERGSAGLVAVFSVMSLEAVSNGKSNSPPRFGFSSPSYARSPRSGRTERAVIGRRRWRDRFQMRVRRRATRQRRDKIVASLFL